jgi:hypothetical protein
MRIVLAFICCCASLFAQTTNNINPNTSLVDYLGNPVSLMDYYAGAGCSGQTCPIFLVPPGGAFQTAFKQCGALITAGSFVVGNWYTIVSAGTTDFTLIGSASNTVGTKFIASGAGTGTGTANGTYTYYACSQITAWTNAGIEVYVLKYQTTLSWQTSATQNSGDSTISILGVCIPSAVPYIPAMPFQLSFDYNTSTAEIETVTSLNGSISPACPNSAGVATFNVTRSVSPPPQTHAAQKVNSPTETVLQQNQSIGATLAYFGAKCATIHGNCKNITLIGHSAGTTPILMLALQPKGTYITSQAGACQYCSDPGALNWNVARGIVMSTLWDFNASWGYNVAAGTFAVGGKYTISFVGTTDFTAIGAASNTIGVSFTATGAGAGTGTATNNGTQAAINAANGCKVSDGPSGPCYTGAAALSPITYAGKPNFPLFQMTSLLDATIPPATQTSGVTAMATAGYPMGYALLTGASQGTTTPAPWGSGHNLDLSLSSATSGTWGSLNQGTCESGTTQPLCGPYGSAEHYIEQFALPGKSSSGGSLSGGDPISP